MKLIFRVCTIILILLIMAGITYANNKDRKGSHDNPLISRMPGFWIAVYQEGEYDSYIFRDSANNKINIEGHKYFIEYRLKKRGQETFKGRDCLISREREIEDFSCSRIKILQL